MRIHQSIRPATTTRMPAKPTLVPNNRGHNPDNKNKAAVRPHSHKGKAGRTGTAVRPHCHKAVVRNNQREAASNSFVAERERGSD